jgi:hypothetical protein
MPSFLVYISHPLSNLLSPGVLRVWYSQPMRDDGVPTPRLHVASPLPTVMVKFPFRVSHTVMLWFHVMVMLTFLSHAPVFLAFPPLLVLSALNLPCRLAALSGMVHSDLLLLLLTLRPSHQTAI